MGVVAYGGSWLCGEAAYARSLSNRARTRRQTPWRGSDIWPASRGGVQTIGRLISVTSASAVNSCPTNHSRLSGARQGSAWSPSELAASPPVCRYSAGGCTTGAARRRWPSLVHPSFGQIVTPSGNQAVRYQPLCPLQARQPHQSHLNVTAWPNCARQRPHGEVESAGLLGVGGLLPNIDIGIHSVLFYLGYFRIGEFEVIGGV